jgi:hypothetical protein
MVPGAGIVNVNGGGLQPDCRNFVVVSIEKAVLYTRFSDMHIKRLFLCVLSSLYEREAKRHTPLITPAHPVCYRITVIIVEVKGLPTKF